MKIFRRIKQTLFLLLIFFYSCHSPYRQFTEFKPESKDIIGAYKLDLEKADVLSETDKSKDISIVFNSNGTFSVTNFPIFELEKYNLCNGNGEWQLQYDGSWHCWNIFVNYKFLVSAQNGDTLKTAAQYYFLSGDEPPYKIYDIISDPDLWAGVQYKKKQN